MTPTVSIIVLTWNHLQDVTKPFLKSIQKTKGVDYEIIFFDNGSVDGTYQWLRGQENAFATHHNGKIKVYQSRHNLGFGGGNNEAVKYASGKYILFLNNDVLFHSPNWLSDLVGYAESHPQTAVGAQLIDFNSLTEFRHVSLPYLGGWCLLIDHDWIKKNGAFHPYFGWAYFEDCELSQRLIHTGYTLKQIPVDIEHLGSISSKDQLDIPIQTFYNQSVYRNLLFQQEKGKAKRIVFFAPGMYVFNDGDYEGKGVGGAEASLILLTRELAKLGYVVDVYNDTTVIGSFHGVNWNNIKDFSYNDYCDFFVLFRNSMVGLDNVYAGVKLFWSCDQVTTMDWDVEIVPYIDATIAISDYHKQYLTDKTTLGMKPIHVIDLGINAQDYMNGRDKNPAQLIYCSVPERGLKWLAKMFPKIRKRVPEATLVITSDYRLWGSDEHNEKFKEAFEGMPGVKFLGKITRSELVRHQLESVVMAYPCDYEECFCISARECMVAGATPVTTDIGALSTTVDQFGILLKGNPESSLYQEKFIDEVVALITGKKPYPPSYDLKLASWERVAREHWDVTLMKMVKRYKPNYCLTCKKQFDNGFDFFKHRAELHPVLPKSARNYPGSPKIEVLIKTTRTVELSHNSLNVTGKELLVPQESASDIIRILTDAYGSDIIESSKMVRT